MFVVFFNPADALRFSLLPIVLDDATAKKIEPESPLQCQLDAQHFVSRNNCFTQGRRKNCLQSAFVSFDRCRRWSFVASLSRSMSRANHKQRAVAERIANSPHDKGAGDADACHKIDAFNGVGCSVASLKIRIRKTSMELCNGLWNMCFGRHKINWINDVSVAYTKT